MLAITLGDPWSVNCELVHQVLGGWDAPVPTVVIGSWAHWQDQTQRLSLANILLQVIRGEDPVQAMGSRTGLFFYDVDPRESAAAEKLSPLQRGQVARASLEALVPFFSAERLSVLTMPIEKHAMNLAGFAYPGHTEWFEYQWKGRACMTLAGPALRVGLVTNHLALADVPSALTEALVVEKGHLLHQTLKTHCGIENPRIAVCGLNPHCGDGGLFGREEETTIRPAVSSLQKDAVQAIGPLPADTAFAFAYRGHYDGVLAMYHDQGLGPLKLVHFDDAVNISGGLKHLRVSPDHGPASDLFLQKKASGESTRRAFAMCKRYLLG